VSLGRGDGPDVGVSDEQLNAFVDGELTPADAAALLERLPHDAALRERVAQLRLAQDLVRHAYAGSVPPAPVAPRHVTAPRQGRPAVAVASLAAGLLLGWLGHEALRAPGDGALQLGATPAVQADTTRIVLHLSTDAADKVQSVLERAEGLLLAARGSGRAVTVEIVANGPGLDLLRAATSSQAQRIEALRRNYATLSLVACGQTMQKLREVGADVRLLPGTQVATSALDEIVLRMQQGWTYLRI
jgi:intracellular sulfur oxidation DsrE/DsrF family protein